VSQPAERRWLAWLCLGASMALVGSYVGLSRVLVAAFPVFLVAWLRFAIGALAMLHWLKRAAGDAPLAPRDRMLLFWESFLGNFLFSICMLYGVALTSAVAAGVILAAIPAAVALLSWLFLGERAAPRVALGIAFAVAGIALLSMARGDGAQAGERLWLGNLLLVGAMLCEASYVVIGKRLVVQVSARRISAIINLWGLALVTPLGAWAASSFDFAAVTVPVWGLLVFYSLAASVWTVWLWMTGLKRVPAASAGVFTILLPISATAIGVGVLGEPFGMLHAAAFVLALAGLALATWPAKAPAPVGAGNAWHSASPPA